MVFRRNAVVFFLNGLIDDLNNLYGRTSSNLYSNFNVGIKERITRLDSFLLDYLPILIFLGLAIGLGLLLMISAFFIAVRNPDAEKISPYECGFNAFGDARMKFDVRFYLVAILFIIFDLEVAFLFPWAISFGSIGIFGYFSMMVFLTFGI